MTDQLTFADDAVSATTDGDLPHHGDAGTLLLSPPASSALSPLPAGRGILTLRPYQVEAVDCAYEAWRTHQAILIVQPTGTGKTVVAAEIIARWPGLGRVLVVAHVRELIYQLRDTIGLHTDEPPSIEMGMHREATDGHPLLDRPKVVVASIQTLTKRLKKFRPEDFDLIIWDEYHHASAATYRRAWDYFRSGNHAIKSLGITATPKRLDGIGLGCVCDHIAYTMSIREAIDEGWLVPIKQKYIRVDELDFSHVRKLAGDVNEKDLEAAMMGGQVDDLATEEERIEVQKKRERMLHAIAAPTIEEAKGRQGIVFCVTVAHAQAMAEIMRRYPGVTAEVVTGETPHDERKDLIGRFKGGSIQFLCGVGCFTEGFDAPNAAVIAMARPTRSVGLYTQMLGRGTRPTPGLVDRYHTAEERIEAIHNDKKSHMTVCDFVNNSNHKIKDFKSSADILAGDMPPDIVERAKNDMIESGVAEDIRKAAWEAKRKKDEEEKAAREEAKRREEERRKAAAEQLAHIRARAKYRATEVSPFDRGDVYADRVTPKFRGGSTDKQVALLERLGVAREQAMAFSKRQAGAVIDQRLGQKGGDFIVRFGKYQGRRLRHVMQADLPWLQWAAKNIQDATFQANLQQFRQEIRGGQ